MTEQKTDYKSIKVVKDAYTQTEDGQWAGALEYQYYTGNTIGPQTGTLAASGLKSKKAMRNHLHAAMKKTVAASRSKNFMKLREARGWNG